MDIEVIENAKRELNQILALSPLEDMDKLYLVTSLCLYFEQPDVEGIANYDDWFKFLRKFENELDFDISYFEYRKAEFEHGIPFVSLLILISTILFDREINDKIQWINELEEQLAGGFYTPNEIVKLICGMVDYKKVRSVYDPCARSGSFLAYSQLYGDKNISLTGNRSFGDYNWNSIRSIITDFPEKVLSKGYKRPDFDTEKFDLILSNPPFGVSNSNSEAAGEWSVKFKSNRSEIIYLTHALDRLNDNGQLVLMMPQSFLNGSYTQDLRENMLKKNWIRGIVQLPRRTFESTATPVAIIYIDKTRTHSDKSVLLINATDCGVKNNNRYIIPEAKLNLIKEAVINNTESADLLSKSVDVEQIILNGANLKFEGYVAFEHKELQRVSDLIEEREILIKELTKIESGTTKFLSNISL